MKNERMTLHRGVDWWHRIEIHWLDDKRNSYLACMGGNTRENNKAIRMTPSQKTWIQSGQKAEGNQSHAISEGYLHRVTGSSSLGVVEAGTLSPSSLCSRTGAACAFVIPCGPRDPSNCDRPSKQELVTVRTTHQATSVLKSSWGFIVNVGAALPALPRRWMCDGARLDTSSSVARRGWVRTPDRTHTHKHYWNSVAVPASKQALQSILCNGR